MTLIEKIEVMKHYESGGDVEWAALEHPDEFKYHEGVEPVWNWQEYVYRIKPKPVELLYEWWYITQSGSNMQFGSSIETEESAKIGYRDMKSYGKTGRYFNPETKEFGVE